MSNSTREQLVADATLALISQGVPPSHMKEELTKVVQAYDAALTQGEPTAQEPTNIVGSGKAMDPETLQESLEQLKHGLDNVPSGMIVVADIGKVFGVDRSNTVLVFDNDSGTALGTIPRSQFAQSVAEAILLGTKLRVQPITPCSCGQCDTPSIPSAQLRETAQGYLNTVMNECSPYEVQTTSGALTLKYDGRTVFMNHPVIGQFVAVSDANDLAHFLLRLSEG